MQKIFQQDQYKQKGFTIIELIVVIAIIAILAAVVMVNVTQYISKSRIAELIADLTQVPIAATNYNYETGSLSGFCIDLSSQTLSNRFIAISGGSDGYRCNDGSYATCGQNYCSSDQWALETVGPDKTKYCVDSSGFKGPSNGDIYHCRATVCSCTRRE